MWRVVPAFALLFAVCLSSAHAAGYEDFSRGISASNRYDDDQAISLFSSALAAGDLNANLRPVAYADRGDVYLRKEQCEQASADFTAALNLKPDFREALMARADANVCQNDLPAAIDDLTAAIKLLPAAPAYFARARLRYFAQDFTGAADDLTKAADADPDNPYFTIWLGLTRLRAGTFNSDEFGHDVSQLDFSEWWPHPILSLLEGKRSPESVLSAATGDGDKHKLCEADFYVGEWQLLAKKPEAAKPLLQQATATCPRDYVELESARIEMARLR